MLLRNAMILITVLGALSSSAMASSCDEDQSQIKIAIDQNGYINANGGDDPKITGISFADHPDPEKAHWCISEDAEESGELHWEEGNWGDTIYLIAPCEKDRSQIMAAIEKNGYINANGGDDPTITWISGFANPDPEKAHWCISEDSDDSGDLHWEEGNWGDTIYLEYINPPVRQ